MTEIEEYLTGAMATCIAIQRDLFRDDAETVAARHEMTVARLVEALAWYRNIELKYRGTDLAAAAQVRATEKRQPLLRPVAEHPSANGDGVGGRMDADRPHPTRPKRRCVRCGRRFKPTAKRWKTCRTCFALAADFGIPF